MKKIKYFIPSIIILIMIFSFSNQNGQESGSLSFGVYTIIKPFIFLNVSENTMILIIRKIAHMSEFGLLALSLLYGFKHTLYTYRYKIAFLFTCLFAMLDEYHQLFIAGRVGSISDVFIDILGALLFLIIIKRVTKY